MTAALATKLFCITALCIFVCIHKANGFKIIGPFSVLKDLPVRPISSIQYSHRNVLMNVDPLMDSGVLPKTNIGVKIHHDWYTSHYGHGYQAITQLIVSIPILLFFFSFIFPPDPMTFEEDEKFEKLTAALYENGNLNKSISLIIHDLAAILLSFIISADPTFSILTPLLVFGVFKRANRFRHIVASKIAPIAWKYITKPSNYIQTTEIYKENVAFPFALYVHLTPTLQKWRSTWVHYFVENFHFLKKSISKFKEMLCSKLPGTRWTLNQHQNDLQ
mmetsp:Transcript_30056/g.39551  ORF Transcript_30056/g.39551 Transcript_30056/m.39551 type:complete len:276 (-) Transcript_30056:424-1251(-)|eukprot:CAMPEP_0117753152 /NCGR_PEP_ID=MMETSP0947-20121206/12051_1 /TAXON_ID=44440 /ORGANISM="Chattonella subsalsa, Strain CCMP2191" /LENGTH=275 /DNA_ID=CAMNT_0005571971 /DNA_START=26 /DNA_END=853 /DNA_ORIENTATION=+